MQNTYYLQLIPTYLIAILVFILIICFYFLGHTLRIKRASENSKVKDSDFSTLNGTSLGLLGLILAFTFSMSNARYDSRRRLIIEEANNIGTAILRADVYPDSMRQILRADFKDYVNARIELYENRMDDEKRIASYEKADKIGKLIWKTVTDYAKGNHFTTLHSQMIPALNNMIDITTTRKYEAEANIPNSLIYFLFILCCCSAFLLGYDNKLSIDWVVVIGFAFMMSLTIYNIIDLDRPRSGFINMDAPHQRMIELRKMFENN